MAEVAGRPRTRLVHFRHDDPFVDAAAPEVGRRLSEVTALGYHGDARVDLDRRRTSVIDRSNPSTAALLAELPAFDDWLRLVPTAAALEPMYRPDAVTLPGGAPLDAVTRSWLRNIPDAVGIRSRAAALQRVLGTAITSERPQWLSLACGAAGPVVDAARLARDQTGVAPELTLVDLDRRSLARARDLARRAGVAAFTRTRRANVLDPRGVDLGRAGARTGEQGFDAVDAVGLLEYLKPQDWRFSYGRVVRTRRPMAGAVSFLANAWQLVAPGGVLVVGNMLDTHPALGFTLNVIQWPHIQPRSVDDVCALMARAGVHGDLEVLLPSDGVYAVYAVRKPDGARVA